MPKPKIALTANFGSAYPSLNYTELTGGSMDWNTSPTASGVTFPREWTGAAFWIGASSPLTGLGRWKAGTGELLKPVILGTLAGISGSSVSGVSWTCDTYDVANHEGGYTDNIGQWNFTSNPAGLRHVTNADQSERTLHYYTQTYGGGWQVEVSLSDGSVGLQTLALPGSDFVPSHFDIKWISQTPCTLQIDVVRRTSGSGGIQCPACYQEKPRPIQRQRY